jgi:hypothetical protein
MKHWMLPYFSGSTRNKQTENLSLAVCAHKAKLFHEALGLEGKFNSSSGWLT